MTSGDVLVVAPGTYAPQGVGFNLGPPSGTSGAWTRIIVDTSLPGQAVIDGSGYAWCISLDGRSYVEIRGLAFRNRQGAASGWSITECLAIRDLGGVPGIGRNSHHILVKGCTFLECTRRAGVALRGAVPLGITSYSDERLEEEGCHHIEVDSCIFHESQSDMKDAQGNTVLAISQLVMTGNVYDWRVDDCVFIHNFEAYREGNGAIELATNYSQSEGNYLTYPDQIRKGCIRRNIFHFHGPIASDTGIAYAARYAVYPHGGADILVENNVFYRWPLGVGLVTEEGLAGNAMARVWVRNNLFVEPEHYALVLGTWANGYLSTTDTYASNNTIVVLEDEVQAQRFPPISLVKRNTTNSPEGVSGDWAIFNNLVLSFGKVVFSEVDDSELADKLDYNLYATPDASPFLYPTYGYLRRQHLGCGCSLDSNVSGPPTASSRETRTTTPGDWPTGRGFATPPLNCYSQLGVPPERPRVRT
jgi:hypothetical protein